jgi:hypothetical protein
MKKKVYALNLMVVMLIATVFFFVLAIYGPYDIEQREIISQITEPADKIHAFFEYERIKLIIDARIGQVINNIILFRIISISLIELRHLNHTHKLNKIFLIYIISMILMNLGYHYLIEIESMWIRLYTISLILFSGVGIKIYHTYDKPSIECINHQIT